MLASLKEVCSIAKQKNMAVGKFFRSDYITIQILKAILSATIVYGACFAIYILYQFEDFMENIYNMDLIAFAKNVMGYYVVTVIGYTIVSYVVCSVRYTKDQKNLLSELEEAGFPV